MRYIFSDVSFEVKVSTVIFYVTCTLVITLCAFVCVCLEMQHRSQGEPVSCIDHVQNLVCS
jgi:hypothetical protein